MILQPLKHFYGVFGLKSFLSDQKGLWNDFRESEKQKKRFVKRWLTIFRDFFILSLFITV